MQNCDICVHLQNDSGQIAKTDHWVVSLAPDQGYLGRCYVTLRKHKGSLADLSEEEWADYAKVVRKLEHSVVKVFNAVPSNWACMMNNAYQKKPSNPHVHWHFRPRYFTPQTIRGVTFEDPLYGHHYDRNQRRDIDSQTFQLICKMLKDTFALEG